MASVLTNGRILFHSIPKGMYINYCNDVVTYFRLGYPVPGETTVYDESEKIDLENVPLNGGALIKTLELSVDPYLRGKMHDGSVKSYAPGFEIGTPLYGILVLALYYVPKARI